QPYHEATPDDPEYHNALLRMQKRVDAYHSGRRYSYCVDQTDVVDANVLAGRQLIPTDGELLSAPVEGVPDRVHWVPADDSDKAGSWTPRRPDWDTVLVDKQVPALDVDQSSALYWPKKIQRDSEVEVVDLLSTSTLASIKSFALKPFPLGLWEEKDGCDFSKI